MLVAPGVPNGTPATMMTRCPALAKPSEKAVLQARSAMSFTSRASAVTTAWTPHASARRRAVLMFGVSARIGGCGRSREMRRPVAPDAVHATMALRSSVSATSRVATAMASAPVASGGERWALMMLR